MATHMTDSKFPKAFVPQPYLSTKLFTGFPCTHRQPADDGHCKYIHGYSRSFKFTFACTELEPNTMFVMHFGRLKQLKQWLDYQFDHTFLANEDDPELKLFEELHHRGVLDLRIMKNVGMEGTARYVYYRASEILEKTEGDRVWITQVEVMENDKNSAIYIPTDDVRKLITIVI